MKRYCLAILLLLSNITYAQVVEDAWVYFLDKPQSSFYLQNPDQMLSPRAIQRRIQQNISYDIKDVPLDAAYLSQIQAASGIEVKATSKWHNAVHIRGTLENIQQLGNFSFVSTIVYANHSLNNQQNTAVLSTIKNEKKKGKNLQQPQINYNYGNSFLQSEMLNVPFLHSNNFTGENKVIAIMDSGFLGVNTTAPFQYIQNQNLIAGTYDFVHRTENVYTSHNHGTMVLSAIAGMAENQLIGTAPNALFYLFITEDIESENPVEESYWVEALEKADSLGVDIVNTSLGYFSYDNPSYSYNNNQINGTSFSSLAADIAFSKGMICVISAGNSGNTSNPTVGVPSDAATALTIGSVDNTEQRSLFSSIGPTSDGRIKPDLMAMGTATIVANQTGTISPGNGTSFSTPLISGAIASLWSAFPEMTNEEIINIVKASADRYVNPDNYYGYGIPDFMQAYHQVLSVKKQKESVFCLYPNPFSEALFFSCEKEVGNTIFEMYNLQGQKVYENTQWIPDTALNLSFLEKGIYWYVLKNATAIQQGKLIKQ